jgi:hypothetical protein
MLEAARLEEARLEKEGHSGQAVDAGAESGLPGSGGRDAQPDEREGMPAGSQGASFRVAARDEGPGNAPVTTLVEMDRDQAGTMCSAAPILQGNSKRSGKTVHESQSRAAKAARQGSQHGHDPWAGLTAFLEPLEVEVLNAALDGARQSKIREITTRAGVTLEAVADGINTIATACVSGNLVAIDAFGFYVEPGCVAELSKALGRRKGH